MILTRVSNLITKVQYIFLSLTRVFHSYFIKAIDHSFYGFTNVINHLGCWEKTRKACKSRAFKYTYKMFPGRLPSIHQTLSLVFYDMGPREEGKSCGISDLLS